MQDTAPSSTTPRALFRAWQATVTYRECGTVTDVQTYTVTMSRTAQGVTATLNGRPADVLTAARILSSAQSENALTVTAEILDTPSTPARAIGKAAAYDLHRELGRLKYRDHYGTAAAALGEPVASLAALTAEQAQTVRSYAYGQWSMTA